MAEKRGHIRIIPLGGVAGQIGLLLLTLGAFVGAFSAARWQIGDMLGELTLSSSPDAVRTAEAAILLAPKDAQARWLLGAALRNDFSPGTAERSIESIRDAVRNSPYQHRWWGELGRSYEQSGQIQDAELAFNKAVSLAPEYVTPNWQLGNFYLRQGRIDEAIAPFRIAARNSEAHRAQVFSIAWNYFGQDVASVERFASDDPDSITSLSLFYASVGRDAEALKSWDRLVDTEKEARKITAGEIARRLFEKGSFLAAVEFARQAGIDDAARVGAITNGDFESSLSESPKSLFGWAVAKNDNKLDIGLDNSVRLAGKRSLRMQFRLFTNPLFNDLQQVVALLPGRRYRIEFSVRTENLRGGSLPIFSVVGGPKNQVLGRSPVLPAGTSDWQKIGFDVDVPDRVEGVRIVTGREPCAGECPLSGILWVDDLRISQIGG